MTTTKTTTSTRRIHLTADDPQEAFDVLRQKRATGETGWDMAEVRLMNNPPVTKYKWCVFRIVRERR